MINWEYFTPSHKRLGCSTREENVLRYIAYFLDCPPSPQHIERLEREAR